MKAISKILNNEIKHHVMIPVITCFLIYILIFILFGFAQLKKDIVIMIIERFLPLMAIILISPSFQYELDLGIHDVISSKSVNILITYLVRLLLRICAYVILTILLIELIKNAGSYVDTRLYFFQSFSIGLVLGSIGFLAFSISSSLIVSYLVPILYYLINWIPKSIFLGNFYLFRLGQGFEPKIGLNIFIALLLLVIGLFSKRT